MKMKTNNNNLLVPFSIAEALKQIHFDKPTMFYYDTRKSFINEEGNLTYEIVFDHWRERDHNIIEGLISAPGYDQVFEWFREHNLQSEIWYKIKHYEEDGEVKEAPPYNYGILNEKGEPLNSEYYFWFYEDARQELILELIKIYKKMNEKPTHHRIRRA